MHAVVTPIHKLVAECAFCGCAGLLEGAHTGTGLGHEFLRHTQRCRLLVHVVDGSSPDPVGDYKAIMTELELFNPELLDKPQVGSPADWQGLVQAGSSMASTILAKDIHFHRGPR